MLFTLPQIQKQLTTSWFDWPAGIIGDVVIDDTVKWTTPTIFYQIHATVDPFYSLAGDDFEHALRGDPYLDWTGMSAAQTATTKLAFSLWNDLIANNIAPSVETGNLSEGSIHFGIYNEANHIKAGSVFEDLRDIGDNAFGGDIQQILQTEIWINSLGPWGLGQPGWDPGTRAFETILHEIGHSLGLSHPGNYNQTATSADRIYDQDTRRYSIMSYFNVNDDGSGTNWGSAYARTPMVHDVYVIQSIYGADLGTRTGDTVYGVGSNAGAPFIVGSGPAPVFTIYDAGGRDTLDLSNQLGNQRIDLAPGSYSSTDIDNATATLRRVNNIGIAYDTFNPNAVIENAKGGLGKDTISGNQAANLLSGGEGDDTISGLAGDDAIEGGSGDDTLSGDAGSDTLDGGANSDTIDGGADGDSISGGSGGDILRGGLGDDTLEGNDGADSINGGDDIDTVSYENSLEQVSVSLMLGGGSGGDAAGDAYRSIENLRGSSNDDFLGGDVRGNVIEGGGGGDTIAGNGGLDSLFGNDGDDFIYGRAGDYVNGGLGYDVVVLESQVFNFAAIDLSGDVHGGAASGMRFRSISEFIGLAGNDTMLGGSAGEKFVGGAGDDDLQGRGGNDTLAGGEGGDNLDGGAGTDGIDYSGSVDAVYVDLQFGIGGYGDAAGDTIIDIEDVTGSGQQDTLLGSDVSNMIRGGGEDDIIDGGAARDYIFGDGGDDTITTGSGADLDNIDGGDDFDTVVFTGSRVFVNLVSMSDPGAFSGGFRNIERFVGTADADTFIGDGNTNRFHGGEGDDFFQGGYGGDALKGGGGVDTLGYAGSLQAVTVAFDSATFDRGFALETVAAGFRGGEAQGDVAVEIENIIGSAFGDILVGNSFKNVLEGGLGDDRIDGGLGDDELIGGAGADRLQGGGGRDSISYFVSAAGVTAALASATFDRGFFLETVAAGFRGGDAQGDTVSGIENIAGSSFGDTLIGDAAGNVLDGDFGADRLAGGLGNDTLIGGLGADYLRGGDGIDTISYRNSFNAITAAFQSATIDLGGFILSIIAAGFRGGEAEGDTADTVENIVGSGYGDTLVGDDGVNALDGYDGNDWLIGGLGDDTLAGGAGQDYLRGDAGADILIGGAGADKLIGGPDSDTASYAGASARVRVALDGSIVFEGDALGDTFSSIARLTGTGSGDVLVGDANGNVVSGGSGNDTIRGLAGNDALYGEKGGDNISGGQGDDRFIFTALDQGGDTINDFHNALGDNDVLHFKGAAFGGLPAGALAANRFVANLTGAATTADHRFIYETDTGILRFDANGTGAGGVTVIATLTGAPTLALADFAII